MCVSSAAGTNDVESGEPLVLFGCLPKTKHLSRTDLLTGCGDNCVQPPRTLLRVPEEDPSTETVPLDTYVRTWVTSVGRTEKKVKSFQKIFMPRVLGGGSVTQLRLYDEGPERCLVSLGKTTARQDASPLCGSFVRVLFSPASGTKAAT